MRLLEKNHNLFISLLFFTFSFLLLVFTPPSFQFSLNKPFIGEHDWNGVRYGNIARNYLRSDLINTKFAQLENAGSVKDSAPIFFTHYPPLLPGLMAISFATFGVSEAASRLVPLVISSMGVSLIYLIGSKLWNIKTGLISSLLIIITPQFLYFGKMPVHEPLVTSWILLAGFGLAKVLIDQDKKDQKVGLILFYLGAALAMLTTWAGYFYLFGILVFVLKTKTKALYKHLLAVMIVAALLFVLHLTHNFVATGGLFGGNLFDALLQRSGVSEAGKLTDFTPLSYLLTVKTWFFTLFTATLTIISLLWWIFFLKYNKDYRHYLVASFLFPGLIYSLVFSNAMFIHNYLTYYFLPFVALSAGFVATSAMAKFKDYTWQLAIVLILVTMIFFERYDYLQALQISDPNMFSYKIANEINLNTNPTDRVLVLPTEFYYRSEKFLRFYGDREVTVDQNPQYDVKVTVNDKDQTVQFERIK
jgi:4-amino-4-deoxy-L-arabinose transferase-like glycosyltransferase